MTRAQAQIQIITTVAGTGTPGFSGDGGPATSARLDGPSGLAMDSAGNLYIADPANNRIRMVNSSGTISTVAGNGIAGFSGNGTPAINAQLDAPTGVAVDNAGNLYIADSGNNSIRMVSSAGTISTVAGNGTLGFSGDGGSPANALFSGPTGVAVDSAGNIYIADAGNSRIRMVNSARTLISTIAGNGTLGFSGDGGAPTRSALFAPTGVAVDSVNNLYIADNVNGRIRKLSTVTAPDAATNAITVAGNTQVIVGWTPPVNTGGGVITSYTVTASPGGATCTATPPATSCAVTGLTNGTPYTFVVVAFNAAGNSLGSTPVGATPTSVAATAPDPVTNISATPANAQVSVSWTTPVNNSGNPITSYTVTASPGGATYTATPPATSCAVTGLSNGTAYTFTVVAANATGNSADSPAAVTTTPGPVTSVTTLSGNRQVLVRWAPPANDGGSAITSYMVTASPGGASCTATAPATSCTITGLTNMVPYIFAVTAINAIGSGASASSGGATPTASALSDAQSIPTLSQWGILLLALMVGGVAALRNRRV